MPNDDDVLGFWLTPAWVGLAFEFEFVPVEAFVLLVIANEGDDDEFRFEPAFVASEFWFEVAEAVVLFVLANDGDDAEFWIPVVSAATLWSVWVSVNLNRSLGF